MKLDLILEPIRENSIMIVQEAVVVCVVVKLIGQFQKELKLLSLKPGVAEVLALDIVAMVAGVICNLVRQTEDFMLVRLFVLKNTASLKELYTLFV
jgi:hypothetical protein